MNLRSKYAEEAINVSAAQQVSACCRRPLAMQLPLQSLQYSPEMSLSRFEQTRINVFVVDSRIAHLEVQCWKIGSRAACSA